MKRLLHNFFQMFRKDSGAHFTYNIGVWFVRAGTAALLLAAALFVRSANDEMHWGWWLSVLLISLTLLGVGIGQERLAMKYPRTDVDLDENLPAAVNRRQTEELMKEFEAAYQKVMHNRDPEPPRTDCAKHGGERLRLEKKDDPRS